MPLICKNIIVIGKRKPLLFGKRCRICHKQVAVAAVYPCKCGHSNLCSKHRPPDMHSCSYDYRRNRIPMGPATRAPKLLKL